MISGKCANALSSYHMLYGTAWKEDRTTQQETGPGTHMSPWVQQVTKTVTREVCLCATVMVTLHTVTLGLQNPGPHAVFVLTIYVLASLIVR